MFLCIGLIVFYFIFVVYFGDFELEFYEVLIDYITEFKFIFNQVQQVIIKLRCIKRRFFIVKNKVNKKIINLRCIEIKFCI